MPESIASPSRVDRPVTARVVLADADQTLHEAYRAPFLQERVELIPAYSGIDCIHQLREHAADALVIDPVLPWGGGEGVLAVLGGTPHWAAIPVMVLTAVRDIHILNGLIDFPIHDFQRKPRTPAELAARLRLLLDPDRPYDASSSRNARLERVIAQRTGNRIRKLRVEATATEVVIHGVTCSHDVRQSALAAVTASLRRAEASPACVKLNIEVGAHPNDSDLES